VNDTRMPADLMVDRIAFDPGSQAAKLAPIPWPGNLGPAGSAAPRHMPAIPAADVLVVTWTAAEARALADVLTPGIESSGWTDYTTGYASYVPQLTSRSPALDSKRLGSWCLTMIGGRQVCCFKSELHPATDGPAIPAAQLITQIAGECGAGLVITTGTAGGAGDGTLLGDVNVATVVDADFTSRLHASPWAMRSFTTAALSSGQVSALAGLGALFAANAGQLPGNAARPPQVWQGANVSTDFFAFDTATDFYGLRKLAPAIRSVEMDDAAVVAGLAGRVPVLSVRNASDPVMPGADITADKQQAEAIYQKYGYWTTVNSAIACWALITAPAS
jgi:nucleoside phosphorylase